MAVYADDLLIVDEDTDEIQKTADGLAKQVELTKLDELKNYPGINIERDTTGIFYMDQAQFLQKIIDRFGLKNAKNYKTPLGTGHMKIARDGKAMNNSDGFQ